MPSELAHEPLPSATQVWAAVSEHLEAFAQAWEAGLPDLAAFLPASPPNVRRLTLVELIKFDMEHRLQKGGDQPLETYFAAFPELVTGGAPCDLLYEDFHLRKRSGQDVAAKDYFRRFPERAAELQRLIGGTSSAMSTSVFGNRPPIQVQAGDRLDDFDLLAMLGEGQFAKVFLARQTSMQRLVALKVSAHRGAEAQTLAQLDHPHIVRVYDQRVLAEKEIQLVYMPYLAGGTLGDVLEHVRKTPVAECSGRTLLEAVDASLFRRGEVVPTASPTRALWAARSWPATVCALGAKLATALDHAHRHNVLHRDVKPANVLLTAEGEPLLADFNIGTCSKVEGAGPSAFFGGSLPYMAPEHIDAFNPDHDRPPESLDGRADVFGLAVTLWELLTGSNPFGVEYLRGSWPETLDALAAHRRAGPPEEALAAMKESDVPGLKEVLLRCLSPDPNGRPETADEMARELELCLRPATRELLRPKPRRWRAIVRRFPVLTIFCMALVPNLAASVFNIAYNKDEIISKWPVDEQLFRQVILAVNNIFFPLGLFILGLKIWPIRRGLRQAGRNLPIELVDRCRYRLRALDLGQITAIICIGCWLLAAAVWPTVLWVLVGPPEPGTGLYIHFIASFIVCGLMAATYPYFLVTFLTVRVIYPALLARVAPGPDDAKALRRVERELGRYRLIAGAIPIAAVGLIAGIGISNPLAVIVLSITGVSGTVLAFVLEGRIRSDLIALSEVPAR
ncbi:MAG TPA: serine/threonine-protein kinase [Gemmataceae bacterium]|jgi:serine/threonine protein kinase|nr:serine/threonine-protein kinase [Gemmataceae bacterium]